MTGNRSKRSSMSVRIASLARDFAAELQERRRVLKPCTEAGEMRVSPLQGITHRPALLICPLLSHAHDVGDYIGKVLVSKLRVSHLPF